MRRGSIVWVEFPKGEGHAQAGRRPAVVLQDEALNLSTVLLAPLSTQVAALRFPCTVLVEPDATNRLRLPSVALVFQIRALDRRFLGTILGIMSEEKLSELLTALDELTGR